MARIEGLPEREAGLLGRLAYRFSRHRFGKVAEPIEVMARHRNVLLGSAAMELALDRSTAVDDRLKKLAEVKVALVAGCEFCVDIGSMIGRGIGIPDEKLRDLPRFEESGAYSRPERLVLGYAVAMTKTPVEVPEQLFGALREFLDEKQMIELTTAIAWENFRARANHAIGIGPQGFSEGSYCFVPEAAGSSHRSGTGAMNAAAPALEPFVRQWAILLTTYRRDGTPVGTPVNVAVEGGRAFFRTWDTAWKLGRIRNLPEVEVCPSTPRGRPTGAEIHARARVLEGEESAHASRALARKYPILHGVLVPLFHRLRGNVTVHVELIPATREDGTG